MSTTVKPLDIYIGDTKVFPDVDLGFLSLSSTSLGESIMSEINTINTNKNCYLELVEYPYIITDTDDTAWHLKDNGDIHNVDNYWHFNRNTYDINCAIDLAWLGNIATFRPSFNGVKTKVLNFKGTLNPTQGYDTDDWENNTLKFSQFWCNSMFLDSKNLEEIHNLNFNQNPTLLFDENWISQEQHLCGFVWDEWSDFRATYRNMFNNCNNLRVLDAEWPSILYGEDFYTMFNACHNLPDNQIPTFTLRPLYTNGTITIENMFNECYNIESLHISADTWPYIKNARYTWSGPNVHTIDIPATATNLINIAGILGDTYWPEAVEGHRDYSNWKYIIRTTSIMTAHLNSIDDNDPRPFNFWDYDNDQDFMNTFGGIYVPDAQLQDWKDMIANDFNAPNVAANCVHGLSEL